MFAAPRSELLALLAAIKAEPEENTPKLALADWLQEQPDEADQARGAFLHRFVQNNLLARTDPARQDFAALVALWDRYGVAWAGRLRSFGFRAWATNHMFRWGLLFPVLEGGLAAVADAPHIAQFEEYAWVAGLAIRVTDSTHCGAFAESPLLDSLVGLRLAPAEGREHLLDQLADSSRVAGLRDLDIGGGMVSFDALDGESHFRELRRLSARNSSLTGEELQTLASAPGLRRLHTLDLSGCGLLADHARTLADGSGLPALTELNLGPDGYHPNCIGDDGLIRLVANPRTGRLRKLNLVSNNIDARGVLALCVQPHMCHLTHLNLSDNRVPNRAAAELAQAEHLKTLEELNLNATGITDEGAFALARSPHLSALRVLGLSRNRIGARAVAALRARFGDALKFD